MPAQLRLLCHRASSYEKTGAKKLLTQQTAPCCAVLSIVRGLEASRSCPAHCVEWHLLWPTHRACWFHKGELAGSTAQGGTGCSAAIICRAESLIAHCCLCRSGSQIREAPAGYLDHKSSSTESKGGGQGKVEDSAAGGAMASQWRDWICHPDMLHAMWPRLLASNLPPSSWLALLGTCSFTRDMTLLHAPQAKLVQHLAPANTPATGPLQLFMRSCRTNPTSLALVNSTVPAATNSGLPAGQPLLMAAPALPPSAANLQAQHVMSHLPPHCLTAITRLQLHDTEVDTPLLQAMQDLPSLTRLDLHDIDVPSPPYLFEGPRFPRSLSTLTIQLTYMNHNLVTAYTSLLSCFLAFNTISNLTLILGQEPPLPSTDLLNKRVLVLAVTPVINTGRALHTLRTLSLPCTTLDTGLVQVLRAAAPLLEDLQVHTTRMLSEDQQAVAVTWRTLRVCELRIDGCLGLPLGGDAGDLTIRIKRSVVAGYAEGVRASVQHLLSEANRRVSLVGTGSDGGTFVWDNSLGGRGSDLQEMLSLLQLSKHPVTRLDLISMDELDPDYLMLSLVPLPAVTHLKIHKQDWYVSHADLLARLPLHVEHVCLHGEATEDSMEAFTRMVIEACRVPGRQARPLHVCIMTRLPGGWVVKPLGPENEVWRAVHTCRAQGHTGVVMEEHWV